MRILALLLLLILPLQMRAEAVRTDHLSSQLISQSRTAVPGGLLMLGSRLQHDDGWHTYWRKPGDSGLPTRISLSLPAGAQAGEILWPLPQRVPLDAQLVNFGYKGTVGRAYDAKTTPHMYVIDKDGVLRYNGAIDSIASADKGDLANAVQYVPAALAAVADGKAPDPALTRPYGCSVKY